jgi:cell division protein FtsB
MKMKKIVIVIMKGLVLLSAIVLVNLYFGCQESLTRSRVAILEQERLQRQIEAERGREEQQKELQELRKTVEELKKAQQK